MRLAWIGVFSAAAVGLLPSASSAAPRDRQGFSVGASVGLGGSTDTCGQCINVERDWGLAGQLRAGWAIGAHVVIGPELGIARTKVGGDTTQSLYSVFGAAAVYPRRGSGAHLKAGLGPVFVKNSYDIGGGESVSGSTENGIAFMGGAGYDLRMGQRMSVTPALTYWRSGTVQYAIDDVVSLAQRKFTVLAFTVGVTFH